MAFLPEGRTEAARVVMAEARGGAATGLVLVGVEGAAPAELARIVRGMQAGLPGTGLFRMVAGGGSSLDQALLFERRYALGPVAAEVFSAGALREDLVRLLGQMRSSLSPLAVQYGLADPTGAFLALVRGWAGASPVRVIEGAWFAQDGSRALLLARTRAGGMDIPAQEAALGAIRAAFEATDPGAARLVMAGPAVFARDAARAIRSDVERISVVSTLLVIGLLWWRFRSPLVLAAVAAPVVASVAVAALLVQAMFGSVHGVALGFGATMLGVSVDYPVLMIGHRKRGEAAPATRARIGRAFVLAVVAALLGLAAMVFSGFPGLVQLGVFAAAGLLSCAVLTWWVLPRLIVRANLAPVAAGDPAWLRRVEGWRRHRWWALAPVLGAAAMLGARGVVWEGDLQALSPVPAASLALDREMRAQVGAADAGPLLLVRGESAEAVLVAQERLLPVLDRLRAEGALRGVEMAARLLPSAATQRARAAALPEAGVLAARLAEAAAGLPFRAGAFAAFTADVEAARGRAPLTLTALEGTALGSRLEPLLVRRDGGWVGPVVLQGVTDAGRVAAAVGDDALFVDMRAELGGILSDATGRAWGWLAASGAAVVAVLLAGLRDAGLAARVMGSVVAALLVTVAGLSLLGARVSLIHLVALQLVAGVGLDYALFFARRQLDAEERARTVRTLVTCNGMTLLTFGLLAGCQTPLLRDIGVTVALGALLAMGFAFMVAGAAPREEEAG
ncbi:MAG: MMPL family transporter [Janthinobacterium lividum]